MTMGKTTIPNAPSETGSDMSPEAKRHEAPPVRANAEKLLRGVFKVADPYFEAPRRSYRAIIRASNGRGGPMIACRGGAHA